MNSRKKGTAVRSRYMMADFTPEEKQRVVQYCADEATTISSFLAHVAMDEVNRAGQEGSTEEQLSIVLRIPVEQSAKLHMFANRRGKALDQYVRELLMPTLKKGKTFFSEDTQGLRYYLSPQEHRRLKQFLKSKKLSARTYVPYLALKAMRDKK
jgi:hypothetical protein